jgi:hypothetical protein
VANLIKVGETSTMDIYEIEGNEYEKIQYLFSKRDDDDEACIIRGSGQTTWTTKAAARENADMMARIINEPTLVE